MPNFAIYFFHALFYSIFWLRPLGRSARPAAPAADAVPDSAAPTARFSRGLVVAHMLAMVVLYLGVRAVVSGRPVRYLFPPQQAAGVVVMLAAAGLAAWTLTVFGSWRLRARIEADHKLSTDGPFRYVRNPIYLGMALIAVGTFLWMPTVVVLVGMLLVFVGCNLRARAEEKVLLAAFGDRYRDYASRVKRFVPGVY